MSRRSALTVAVAALALPLLLALAGAARWHATNASSDTLRSYGVLREYLLHVPPSYDSSRKTPLVISLHGAGLSGAGQRDISGWNAVADSAGFIVVYPSGAKPGFRVWRSMSPSHLQPDVQDVHFFSMLMDTLQARYNIDPARVYVNGLSNGGGMSWALACTLSDRIAAVGLVGAALFLPFDACPDTTPVPAVVFHGTDDRQARYRGGASWVARDPFQPIPSFVASWAKHNRCSPAPQESRVAPDVTRKAYGRCARGADVVFYTIEGGGHTWPGGPDVMPDWFAGRTTHGIDASRVMWDFFQAHPRAGR